MNYKGIIAASALAFAWNGYSAESKAPTTPKEKASYGIGTKVGTRFKHELLDIDLDAFVKGFRDSMSGAAPAISEKEIEDAIAAMTNDVAEKMKVQGEKNKKIGDAFLAENKKAKGVVTTESGLQYQVLREGNGPTPKEQDEVKVHYKGTLIDGTVFDSSYERNEPVVFPVGGVIKGWVEGLQKMKVGSKYKLFIPAELAYGEVGQGKIPAGSTLIFEVELLEIEKGATP